MVITLYVGADHGGFAIKAEILELLKKAGYQAIDCGAYTLDPTDDYPQYAFSVAQKVASENEQGADARGILLCRSGIGVAIAANKVRGIRAATVHSVADVHVAREHTGITVLALASDQLTTEQAWSIINEFLVTAVSSEERHQRRIANITRFEKESV